MEECGQILKCYNSEPLVISKKLFLQLFKHYFDNQSSSSSNATGLMNPVLAFPRHPHDPKTSPELLWFWPSQTGIGQENCTCTVLVYDYLYQEKY